MFGSYKDATSCYNNQSIFENRNQASFPPGESSKQTSGPPWDYSQQAFSTVPCYTGDQTMNHRHTAAIHNSQVVSQYENKNILAHYRNISTGSNSNQSVVRPRAVINCQSNCNACYNHSVARIPHPWNPPSAESMHYITGNSAVSLPGDEIPRFAPNLAGFSQHEDSSHHFTSGFATQLTKLSKFAKDPSPGILSTATPKNDILSPVEDSSVLRPQHHPSRVEPISEKYIPPVPSENTPAKKDSCVACHGVCARPNCKLYEQQTVKFPSLEPISIQQYGVSRENVRYTRHSVPTLNGGSSSCNQWHQSPGLWLQNGHPPGFWMPASEDIHSMGNAGMTNFWSDRSSCEISGQQMPLPPNYHDRSSNKSASQMRSHLPSQQQKGGGTLHDGERNDKLRQNMFQQYQKVSEIPQRYSEMSVRQKSPEKMAVSQVYHELLPRRSQQHEPLVECGMPYRQDVIQRHQTQVVKSHMEIQSNKDDRGLHEPPNTITSELRHQDIARSHISSNGINSGPVLPNFPPTSTEMHTDQSQQDILRKYPVTNFAAYPPHDAKVSASSSSNYSTVLGIAQAPSRFSSNVTYTQSKISRSNNYMRLFSEPCLEDSFGPSGARDVSSGFVSNSSTVTVNSVATTGPSHQQMPYHNKEIPNTGMNCSVQIQSPSNNTLSSDSILRYGSMKDSSKAPVVITTSTNASAATAQISPHLQSCGRMSSDNISSYHSGSATMQVVESDPSCSLGNPAGLNMNPKILNSSSYIISPPHRRESVLAGSQHVPYQNFLAGVRSENVPTCNMFRGNNSSMLHSGLFDDFGKNYNSAHILGTKADMLIRPSKQNSQIIPPNIYSQSNMSASIGGVEQQLLPQMDDMGSSRPVKKRKPHTKGKDKRDRVQLLGKHWHQGRSSRQAALAPVLDVRQFLATWDEETDNLSPAPQLPDVVLSNSSTENPLLVLDCRNLNTNGVATLSTVDRNSLSDGSPTENLIHMYQQHLASPSESSIASNDTVKSNSQTLQENSDVMAQSLGECPSLIPIDPDRLEKFGPSDNCIKSSPEHRTFEHDKPSFHQRQEGEPSTQIDVSKSSVSKSDIVDGLVEASTISVIDKIHNSLDNITTHSVISDNIPVRDCHTLAESLSSQTSPLPENCDSFNEIHEKSNGTDSENSVVVQDESRTSDDDIHQDVQLKSKCESKNDDCLNSDQKMPLSYSEIQHMGLIRSLEKKHADYHQSRKGRTQELPSLISNNRTVVHTLKALCRSMIERSTEMQQTFEKQICSYEKTSVTNSSAGEIKVLGTELFGTLCDKEVEKPCAESSSSVLDTKNITKISCSSENSYTKNLTVCLSESTELPSLSNQTNYVSHPKIQLKKKPSANNKALYEKTENTRIAEKDVKSFTHVMLMKEKTPKETSTHTSEISYLESNNVTQIINNKKATSDPALKLFDIALHSSRFNTKTVSEDALVNTDIVPAHSPSSPNMTENELSNTHLSQNSIEQDITENKPVITEEEKLSEQDVKSGSTEPVELNKSGRGLHDVSVSVTSESETNQLNLFSYSSDLGEDLDMSVTSSTPATPVNVEEVEEESGSEELDMMYQGSVLSDLDSDIRFQSHDCISFSSLPCISKKPACEDDEHSCHSLGILESLDKSHGFPGTPGGNIQCPGEENIDSEVLSNSKGGVVGMCALKFSDKTYNNKCVLVSSSQTESLGNNTELSSCSESSLDIPVSCVEDARTQSIKLPPCLLLEVNHESDLLPDRIQDVNKVSDVSFSHTVVLGKTKSDGTSIESDEKVQLESEGKSSTEFKSAADNSAVEACKILHCVDPVSDILEEKFNCSHDRTKVDCILVSKPDDCEKDNISNPLLCAIPAITLDSNHQIEDTNAVDKTLPHAPSDTKVVLCEELDLKGAENKMDVLSKEVSLDVSVKNISAASIHSVNGDHYLLVGKELRQRKDCLLLNDNTVVQTSSSFSDNPLTPGRSEVALSDWEGTLRVDDEFQDAEVPSCGHSEILYGYHSKQLVIEETDNEISEVLPLLEGSTCSESLEISKNYATVKESVLETTVSCPEIVIHVMKEKEINPVCGGSEVNQLLHCDCNVKEVPNSKTSYDISPKSPSVQPSSPDMTIRDQNLSQTHENSMGRHAPHKEDSSSLYVKLISSSGHSYSRSVVPLVSESQTIPKHVLLHQQKFCDSNGEDKLPIAATGNENKQNCKPICDKSKNTEELQNKNSLLITGAKSATIQDNVLILSSQKTVELKSSTGHYQTSDELESEIVAHDYQVIDCELQSAVTKLPFQDAGVADCKTCHLDSLNLSKNTSSERQEDSSPKEKLITGINGSPDDTESQNMEHLQKNVINISYTEQNIGTIIGSVADDVSRVDSSITDSDGDISCLEQNVVGSVTATGVSDPVVDDDDGDDAAVTTTVVAVVSHEDGGDHDAVPGNADATTGDHYDGTNSDTDDVASTTTTAFTASTDSIHDYDDAEIGNDGVAVSTAASAATTTTDEADTAGNVDAYTSCKDQSKVTCLNPCVTDSDTTTATTIVGDANTTTAVTTVCNADTFADITSTITTTIASSTVSSATDITPDDTDDANTADDKVDVHIASVITVAAVATSATITTVTITAAAATTTTPTSSATTTFAATTTTTATAATITTNDDCDNSGGGGGGGGGSSSSSKDSGVTESLVSYAVEEDWQYEANIQCVSINQMASRSQETERNGAGMEQRHITSLVTSGSVTVEEEDTVKLSVSTTENQKCYQPKGKLGTTLNIELEPNCKLSAEVNHNESQKSITPCKGPTSPAYSSHGTCHTECDYTRKLLGDPKTAESKSQQQDKSILEEISHEMDSVANRVKPLQLQCQFTVEPTKDELNNYVHKLHGDSSAFSFREECLSLEEMRNSLLDTTHDVPVQQEHYCLEDSVKDEICNFELNVPADTPVQPEFKSSNRIIKDEINCEINIASGNVSIPHEYYSPLELNKEEIGDFKINMPENVSCCLSAEQDSSEDLDKARIASCTLHISAESSLKEECLSVQEINSKPNSPISENSELVQNNTLILTNTERTVELVQSNMSTQNSPHRQEADLSVDTDDMPHLEVIDRDVSPNSSDSLEMPCLELITDCVQPMGSDVQCPGDISASASSVPPLHIFPESIHTNAKGNSTELGISDAEELQENDSLTLKVTMLSQDSMHESEHHRDREMSVHSQDQVINSTDIELPKKHLSSVSTTGKTYFGLEEENFTEDFVIHEDPPVEGHILSVSHNSDVLQDDQKRYLSTESLVTEECGGSIVKAVECEIQEVSVTPETLQDISGYLDSGTASVKVVEVSPEYMQVLHTDVSGGWNSVHLVTSDMTCSTSCEKTQTDTKDILTDEEVLASTDVGNTKLPGNFEHETLLMSVELNESATETSFNIEAAGTIYLTDKENDALSSVCSENVNLTTDALPDISVEPSSLVYSVLPGLDPSLGEIMPIDSVSNWPYLEEEVFSGLLATETDSSSSVPIGPCLTAVLSIPGSNNEDTAKSESSLFSDCNRQYNFHTQSDSNDAPVAINGLKCRLSWKKIFALSKGDKKRKQETKKGENPKVTSENFKCANSGQQLKEYSEICHASDNIKLVNKCERLNGNLNRHIDLKDERISGLELGPAKIEVRLPPSPSPRGHLKAWRVIDGPKAERVLDQGGSKTVLSDASAGNISCRSVARAVEPLTSELTQMPIVLVKRLILKRRCDDDDDGAGSDMKKKKKKKLNCRELSDPITRSLGNDGFTQVTVSSEQIEVPDESVCDFVTPHDRRLQDSEHLNGLQERCDSSNSTLMNNSSLSPQIETQAAVRRESSNSESEEDQSSHTSIESNSGEAEFCKCCSSSTCILSEGKCLDGIATPADTYKTHDDCIDDSKPFDIGINLNISYNELPSANSSVSSEDNTKQQLPRVIIKRTVGMGNTNKYQSFLRSVSSSDESCNRWQPIVQLERNLSLDELAKNSSVNNGTLKAAKMPDNLRHGLKISLKSAPGHPYVTLVPLPSLPCSPVDKNKSHSERAKKRRCGIIPSRIRSRHGDVNHWNPQRHARKFTSLKSSSFYVRHDHDPCLMSLPTDNRQLPSPKSCRSQRSPPIKLKLCNGSSRVKNGTLKMDKNISVTGNCGDGGDEYVVVENRNYTKDSMTKITFQRHKRKEVSVRKECNEIEMKVNKFKSDLDIPAVPDKNILSVHEIETICSEDSSSTYDLTVPSQGTVQRRLSIEFDQETSKKELHHFHKKHMPNISHATDSSGQEIATVLEDTGDMVSEDCSQSDAAILNYRPSAALQPETVQSRAALHDGYPKISKTKKRQYFDDVYLDKDVLPLFQPDRILSVSSTKKKQSNPKMKCPKLDGKALEEEIISLSADVHMDYSDIFCKQVMDDTVVKSKGGQKCSTEGCFGTYPRAEECPEETLSSKDDGLVLVSSSKESEPELHVLNDCGTECVGSSSILEEEEEQKLWSDIQPNVVESTEQGDDACQACGHIYSSRDERTLHIRRHPYHCQRCHLAFRSEVDFMSHLSERHPRTRERHHCLLCERSFPTAERYKLHLSGRAHRHLELTQRRTIHTLFSIFTGHSCPVLTPLSDSELAGLKWFPVEPGTIHFYHQATPLQRAMQDLLLQKEGSYTDAAGSNNRTPEDYPSKSGDSS